MKAIEFTSFSLSIFFTIQMGNAIQKNQHVSDLKHADYDLKLSK